MRKKLGSICTLGIAWLLFAAPTLTNCFAPEYASCTLRCDPEGHCPSGLTCGDDGFCNASPRFCPPDPRADAAGGSSGGAPTSVSGSAGSEVPAAGGAAGHNLVGSAGASGSAGSGGAAGSGGHAPTPHPCPIGAFLCEDFESGQIDRTRWSISVDQDKFGSVEVSDKIAFDSTYGLRANAKPGGSTEALLALNPLITIHPLFVRFYVYAPLQKPVRDTALGAVFQSQGAVGKPSVVFSLLLEPDGSLGQKRYVDGEPELIQFEASPRIANMHWTCVEWRIAPGLEGQAAGRNELWLDGIQLNMATLSNQVVDPPVDKFMIGLVIAGKNNQEATVWFDDIVIAKERIGCL